MSKPTLSFVQIGNFKAKVVCICGWESEPATMSPHDPAEALVAYSVEHLVCDPPKPPPVVYYAVAQEMNGKMCILSDLDSSPGAKERAEEGAKGLAQKGMSKQVLEIKVSSSWIG